jgi:hypothetical protein
MFPPRMFRYYFQTKELAKFSSEKCVKPSECLLVDYNPRNIKTHWTS